VPKDGSDDGFFDLLCATTNGWNRRGAPIAASTF
jgi:hypothetical protein